MIAPEITNESGGPHNKVAFQKVQMQQYAPISRAVDFNSLECENLRSIKFWPGMRNVLGTYGGLFLEIRFLEIHARGESSP